MYKNSDVTADLPDPSRCMWQITPKELPKDLPPFSLELWQVWNEAEKTWDFMLFQMFTNDRKEGWYNRVEHTSTFKMIR